MRIVIDMQGAQTESRYRGIGRYTLSFAKAVVHNRGEHEIFLALSGLFPDTIEPLRATFDGLLPQENIRVWSASGPVREGHPGNEGRRAVAEILREAFLRSLQPDIIHVVSLFEGYVDDAVTSIGRFDSNTPVSVTLHDLIPLLNPDQYLKPNPNYAHYYHQKFDYLKKATILLTNSESTKQEALAHLNTESSSIINVSTGIDASFQAIKIDDKSAARLFVKYHLTRPFILYTGGADRRKNLPRLIQAYSSLPGQLRQRHQLLFAGKMPEGNINEFKHQAKASGLNHDELCFTGYVSDEELIELYNLCELFVFPSWHEGFGLPALEAMSCGAPVIGANTSSLPEVIGLEEALFDPLDVGAISQLMAQALTDEAFRVRLREHGLQQAIKFSWDDTARWALRAWEALHNKQLRKSSIRPQSGRKPLLAFISPLPPERTGIADYSAELLPALSAHYDIELVVAQPHVDDRWVNQYGKVRDVAWLRTHAGEINRVLYQMGNSPYHRHMLTLMEEIPGTLVLHDFFMSGLMAWLDLHGGELHAWIRALQESHGYGAVCDRYRDTEEAKRLYPVNWRILQHAQGVIVHSDYSRSLARQYYASEVGADWEVIPLVRTPAENLDKQAARKRIGIRDSDFIVCSFGYLDCTKLNHRLLKAWLESELADDKRCQLVFVGENHGGDYGASLLKNIRDSGLGARIRITGFTASEVFRQYLAAADLAVQLRTDSRGETSAAVMDCMNHALPLIVNANGSMAELDAQAVWMLPEEFPDGELVEALETLWRNSERRRTLGERARRVILERHTPNVCAASYAAAIEHFHQRATTALPSIVDAIARQISFPPDDAAIRHFSQTMATSLPLPRPARRLYLDITATCSNDLKTGIERVARAIVMALLLSPPPGYRIEPVYLINASGAWQHRYARHYTLGLLGCPTEVLVDEPIDPQNGDIMLGLDISGDMLVQAERTGLYRGYRDLGVIIQWMVHDLLPIHMPDVFPPGANETYALWLRAISNFDGAICVSNTVADDLAVWRAEAGIDFHRRRRYNISWSHHGADVANSAPSTGLSESTEKVLGELAARPSFLMVGTIEPRKGYTQTIEAFSQLWQEGTDINLVIVGKEGWKDLPDSMRRDIPLTVARLRTHPELNQHLFWLEGISDEYLEKLYAASTCLIAASYGEGFGLPLIEAAKHKIPIIARDIRVFREVAGKHAYYFNATTPDDLGRTVKKWLTLFQSDNHPESSSLHWITWQQSAATMLEMVMGKNV